MSRILTPAQEGAAIAAVAREGAAIATLLPRCREALAAAEGLIAAARRALGARVTVAGALDRARLEAEQFAAHGLAWLATYGEALRETLAWAEALAQESRLGPVETLILRLGFGEYLAQMAGGIAMSQGEIVRPGDLGVEAAVLERFRAHGAVQTLIADAGRRDLRWALAQELRHGHFGDAGLDEVMALVRDQFRRFAEEKVMPHAHAWHLEDALIPDTIIEEMSALGVFGLTIPEAYGGAGLGKMAMCIVSEELSRGYIGVGSLGTRSEIAAELILAGGTPAQKQKWLPQIAAGKILPTAVFTEPNTGSDLGALSTRAVRDGAGYRVTGAKTWITHAARADLMTLLVRTDPATSDYRGLSMLLAEKPRGTPDAPFPAPGMTGGEIAVLGYRGMKEYEIGFDGFVVAADNLLGGVEGEGFKQLMTTFEAARIQTAARAIGVAEAALELGLRYALERRQFGKPIFEFARVWGKLVSAAVEIMMVRQLSYRAARAKDTGKRCDLEAGMAKLLAARVAWASADSALQIHGGNGYALEYPISRLLCDARILNVFEGAAEIQADVIARRLLSAGH
ncbi:MAG: acyl-CoA dehydrogenase family protein [Pseudomonadota bacterium]